MKYILPFFIFCSPIIIFAQSEELSINFSIELANAPAVTYSEEVRFYKHKKLIAKEEVVYISYKMSFSEKCFELFNLADSLEIRFRAFGIFENQYEYRIGLDKTINLFDTSKYISYHLDIIDLVNRGKNKRIIKKINAPYLYTFSKFNGRRKFYYSNWSMEESVKFKYHKFEKSKNLLDKIGIDYKNYRDSFWENLIDKSG